MGENISREMTIHALFDTAGRGLEIGPSYNAIVPKSGGFQVEIVDHVGTEELRAKYLTEQNIDASRIEEVDHVWDGRPLSEVIGELGKYDYIVASHVIEHLPDLLGFFKECEILLKPAGVLVLAIPDKRRCFDLLRPISTTGCVLAAHLEKRTRHVPATAFDHVAYFATLDGRASWSRGEVGVINLVNSLSFAKAVFDRSSDSKEYFDFHTWIFTPSSFRLILRDLNELGVLDLCEVHFQQTPSLEFLVIIGRSGNGCPLDRVSLLSLTHQELTECPMMS